MLGVDDERLGEIAAWDEVPYPLREAILVCCIAEKNTGKPIDAEAVAAIARRRFRAGHARLGLDAAVALPTERN